MCVAALALSVLVAPCEPLAAPVLELRPPVRDATEEARRLTDPELSRIRGGYGYIATRGRDGILRLVQNSNMRDMSLAAPVTTQQMDAWWNEVGSAYIAAGFSQR